VSDRRLLPDEVAAAGAFGRDGAWAVLSLRGTVRAGNEDRVRVIVGEGDGAPVAIVVADGVGGHELGEVAAEAATAAVSDVFAEGGRGSLRAQLRSAVRRANAAVLSAQLESRSRRMATTLTIAALGEAEAVVAHVGDTRAYRVGAREVNQLTADHTQAAEMLRVGLLTAEEAARHPARSVLTRSLGAQPAVAVDLVSVQLSSEDALFVCSDGIWGQVERHVVQEAIAARRDPEELLEGLWEIAEAILARGAPDNLTAAVVVPEREGLLRGGSGEMHASGRWWRRLGAR